MDVTLASQSLADHWDGPGHWWPLFPLLWFAFIVGFFFIVSRFGWWGRRRWYSEHHASPARSGQTRLAERFAAGEIDEQEYRARLAVLDETTSGRDRG